MESEDLELSDLSETFVSPTDAKPITLMELYEREEDLRQELRKIRESIEEYYSQTNHINGKWNIERLAKERLAHPEFFSFISENKLKLLYISGKKAISYRLRQSWQTSWGIHNSSREITQKHIALLEKSGFKCNYCKVPIDLTFEIDHIMPRAKGGLNSFENLAIACQKCNAKKGSRLAHEFKN